MTPPEKGNPLNLLVKHGKKVIVISEWPELHNKPQIYIGRPFNRENTPTKSDIIKRQNEYRNILKQITNATIIDTLDLFIIADRVRIFDDNGFVLYKDDDNLTYRGALFIVDKLLKNYIPSNNQQ